MPEEKSSIQADVEKINRIPIVQTLLDVVCRATGMGFAAIARVTEDSWVACSVKDNIAFGLKAGGELKIETTICNEIRHMRQAVIIDHVAKDDKYFNHHTPAMYGFQSYISVPIYRKNGEFFGTLCAIDPSPNKLNTPEIRGMFDLYVDLISLHLNALEEVDFIETRLKEELKTAELREQFIAILGHDLRNPLGAVFMGADLLLSNSSDKEVLSAAKIIKTSSYRMSGLRENILDFARGRLGGGIILTRKNDETLEASLSQVITELRTIYPTQIIDAKFNLSIPVNCDSNRIAQLFSNLLSNAITHGEKGSLVKVEADSDNKEFKISVSNSGEKIPATIQKHLFQPFSRGKVKEGQQGLGLGLYIASEIANAHEGNLSVMSTESETRFTFKMPNNLLPKVKFHLY